MLMHHRRHAWGTTCNDTATAASLLTHVDANDPPFLHLYGDADTTSPPVFGSSFHDAFVAAVATRRLYVHPLSP